MTSFENGKGAIFDLDGVLIDSAPAHKQSWYELAEKQGYPMSEEIFNRTFGLQSPQILAVLAGRELPAELVGELSDWKEKRFREIIAETVQLSAGGYELLNQLKDNGFRLAIGSSAPRANLDLVLGRLQLQTLFDALVSQEDTTRGKPAPDTFLKAAQKLSLPPARCVVVEDAVHGVKAGKAAGMFVIALTTTTNRQALKGADIIADGLDMLTAKDFTALLTR